MTYLLHALGCVCHVALLFLQQSNSDFLTLTCLLRSGKVSTETGGKVSTETGGKVSTETSGKVSAETGGKVSAEIYNITHLMQALGPIQAILSQDFRLA
jgi:hypothetical protein